MWKNIAQSLNLKIPEAQLDQIAPVLDVLWEQTRRVLDRDLSAIEPAIKFHPGPWGDA